MGLNPGKIENLNIYLDVQTEEINNKYSYGPFSEHSCVFNMDAHK